jgi:TatD DNase family protein
MNSARERSAPLVDTHAHLYDERIERDLRGVLERAMAAGVEQIIAIGSTADTSNRSVAVARSYRGIFAAVGIHPNDAAAAAPGDWEVIAQLVTEKEVVAIGETGLDRYWDHTPFAQQQEWFERHLELACRHDLPIVIHCRDCHGDIISQLRELGRKIRGVMHAFTGSWDEAQIYLELGLHLSFAGMVTFTNKTLDELRSVAARAPIDRVLVETDTPYLSPHPFRGKTNEPARVAETAARIAELRALSATEFASCSSENARRLFRLDPQETLAISNSSESPV